MFNLFKKKPEKKPKAKPKSNHTPTREDFDPLTDLIERGIEDAMASVREKYPNDKFFAYVLSTYGDRSSVSFHANSYENLARIYADSGLVEGETDKGELAYYKWGWMEWLDYEFIGEQKVLEETWTWLDECRKRFSESEDSFSDAYFEAAFEHVPDCMVSALKRCDAKGVFGTGKIREACLLYTGEYDGGEEADMYAQMKVLNPPHVMAHFEDEFRQFLGPF